MNDAVRTVDEASDKAFGAAEKSMDKLGNVADHAADKAGRTHRDAGNVVAY